MIRIGASSSRPSKVSFTTSSRSRPRRCDVAGLQCAALSQVSYVNGLGSSCSQPLLAKRPSQTLGSGRKASSRPPCTSDAGAPAENPSFNETCLGGSAVPAITPSLREVSHNTSKSELAACCEGGWLCQYSRTMRCPDLSGCP